MYITHVTCIWKLFISIIVTCLYIYDAEQNQLYLRRTEYICFRLISRPALLLNSFCGGDWLFCGGELLSSKSTDWFSSARTGDSNVGVVQYFYLIPNCNDLRFLYIGHCWMLCICLYFPVFLWWLFILHTNVYKFVFPRGGESLGKLVLMKWLT